MKTAWLSLLALGIAASITTACEITTSDGSSEGGSAGDSGGSTAKGGTGSGGAPAAGGKSNGGATAAGGKASGGASSGGGASTDPVVKCDDLNNTYGTPAPSCEFDKPDDTFCHVCLSGACCDAVKQCYGLGPGTIANQCAYGGPDGGSEFTCFEACIVTKTKANGGDYSTQDVRDCAGSCGTPECNGLPGDATNQLILCMTDECEKECILDPAAL